MKCNSTHISCSILTNQEWETTYAGSSRLEKLNHNDSWYIELYAEQPMVV